MGQALTLNATQLKQALKECRNDRERAMILLSAKAGLRAVEIAGLDWKHIDLQQRWLHLTTTKGDKPRKVPIAKDLLQALHELGRPKHWPRSGLVFTNQHKDRGAPLTANAVAQWFKAFYSRRLGWKGFSSHSGRRSFATNAARQIITAGGSLRDVQDLLGHENLATTSKYIEVSEDAKRRVIDLI